MGSNGSKPNIETVAKQKSDLDCNSTSDPRSPTPEIVRTPLHGNQGAKHDITKNVDLTKTFENANNVDKLIHNNPILSAVIKNHLQSYDPRSPTQDFERTPIVISTNDKVFLRQLSDNCASPRLVNDEGNYDSCAEAQESGSEIIVPKNLCNQFDDITLDDTIKDDIEPLGSSTASEDSTENKIAASEEVPKKLLETNFDYIDGQDQSEDDDGGHITLEMHNQDNLKNIPLYKVLDIDPRSPSNGIERTPLVISKDGDSNDNVEDMSDESLIKVLEKTNIELRQNGKARDTNEQGLLVYEDEITTINDTPKKSKSSNDGSRTPLSCMKNKNGSHGRSKSANMLYDPKKVGSKIPKRSHIPRLKSLVKGPLLPAESSVSLKFKTASIAGDCENTPPNSHRDSWDKDTSIVL